MAGAKIAGGNINNNMETTSDLAAESEHYQATDHIPIRVACFRYFIDYGIMPGNDQSATLVPDRTARSGDPEPLPQSQGHERDSVTDRDGQGKPGGLRKAGAVVRNHLAV